MIVHTEVVAGFSPPRRSSPLQSSSSSPAVSTPLVISILLHPSTSFLFLCHVLASNVVSLQQTSFAFAGVVVLTPHRGCCRPGLSASDGDASYQSTSPAARCLRRRYAGWPSLVAGGSLPFDTAPTPAFVAGANGGGGRCAPAGPWVVLRGSPLHRIVRRRRPPRTDVPRSQSSPSWQLGGGVGPSPITEFFPTSLTWSILPTGVGLCSLQDCSDPATDVRIVVVATRSSSST